MIGNSDPGTDDMALIIAIDLHGVKGGYRSADATSEPTLRLQPNQWTLCSLSAIEAMRTSLREI
jgi:hypothetical protein